MTMSVSVTSIVSTILKVPENTLGPESGPRKVKGWDSLNHLQIILALEAETGRKCLPQDYPRTVSLKGLEELFCADTKDALALPGTCESGPESSKPVIQERDA